MRGQCIIAAYWSRGADIHVLTESLRVFVIKPHLQLGLPSWFFPYMRYVVVVVFCRACCRVVLSWGFTSCVCYWWYWHDCSIDGDEHIVCRAIVYVFGRRARRNSHRGEASDSREASIMICFFDNKYVNRLARHVGQNSDESCWLGETVIYFVSAGFILLRASAQGPQNSDVVEIIRNLLNFDEKLDVSWTSCQI